MTRILAIGVVLCGSASQVSADDNDRPQAWSVNCNAGQSIARAVQRAAPGDTIVVTGTCRERVVITQPVSLHGRGTAVIDGSGAARARALLPELDGVIVVDGTTGVALSSLTVRNGRSNGIVATRGAAVIVKDVIAEGNAFMGLSVSDNSVVEIVDSVTRSNGVSGFDVFTSSSLILRGTFTASDNASSGGEINGQSIVELRGAQVTIANNAAFGIIAGSQSQLAVFGFEAARGSTLNVSGGAVAGIGLAGVSSLTLFSDTIVTVANNGVGILVTTGSHVGSPPFSASRLLLHSNGVGMNVSASSNVFAYTGLEIHDNGIGVLVDEASLHLEPASGMTASIASNNTDVQLAFGSRSTIENVTVGTALVCEANVLSRGTVTCP
jgi:hypothetical protein